MDHWIVSRLCRVWAPLAEAADRDIDDLWGDGTNGLFADAEAVGDAGAEILHEHIGAGGEAQQRLTAAVRLQVKDNRALIAVVVQERG